MGKVIVSMFVSLDGVMQAPGGEEGLGERGGWSIPFFNEEMGGRVFEILQRAEAMLLGRVSYEHFAKAWPAMTDDETGFAERMNSMPKYVVTSTLDQLEWNAERLGGDPAESVARLKDEVQGDLLINGSGELVHSLTEAALIDEYILFVHPIVVGTGKRLFRESPSSLTLQLSGHRAFSGGVIELDYAKP